MRLKRLLSASVFALAATIAVGQGEAIAGPVGSTVGFVPGSTYDTAALTGFATDGSLMGGTVVTMYFVGGGSETAVWSGGTSSATGTGWSISHVGDTFNTPWTLSNVSATTIIGFLIDGVPGNTVFDTIASPETSPGSALGNPFGTANASDDTAAGITGADATYSNRLQVGGVFYGDLYTRLGVTFDGTGLTSGNTFTFIADTDNARSDLGGIVPVPAPAGLAVFGVGLAGLGLVARRRRA